MKQLLIILVFFACIKSIGQNKILFPDSTNYVITGKVYDSTLKQYLSGAIVIFNKRITTATTYDGSFRLKLSNKYSKKNFSILVVNVLYEPKKIKIKNKKSTLNKEIFVYLNKRYIDMNEVFIIR